MSDTDDSFAPTRSDVSDASRPRNRSDTVSFASYNVLHGRLKPKGAVDLDAYATAVGSLNADVTGLQEVDRRQRRSRWSDMPAIAAVHAGPYFFFAPAKRRWDLGLYGNALVSRWPIVTSMTLRLPRHSWRNERRTAAVATVEVHEAQWSVATTHLSLHAGESAEQLDYLLDVMTARPGPRVVMGDLNRLPEEVVGIANSKGWTTVVTDNTYPSWDPHKRIDFVLVQDAEVVGSDVYSLEVSDHCAVVAHLKVES